MGSSKNVAVGLPTLAAVILGSFGGVAQLINYAVIPAGTELHSAIAVALLFLVGVGIPPLTGQSFRAAVHLPSWAYYVVGALMAAATLTLTSVSIGPVAHQWVAVALTVLSGLGFSASTAEVPVIPPLPPVPAPPAPPATPPPAASAKP